MKYFALLVLLVLCAAAPTLAQVDLSIENNSNNAGRNALTVYRETKAIVEFLHITQQSTHCIAPEFAKGWRSYDVEVCVFDNPLEDDQILSVASNHTDTTIIVLRDNEVIQWGGCSGRVGVPEVVLPNLAPGSYQVVISIENIRTASVYFTIEEE